MRLHLLRHKVPFRDLEFFLVCIARNIDDFHPVPQRVGDRVFIVGGGDEQHAAQIEGHIDVVIPEREILLRVQRLQQRRGGVALIILAELIHFVQQNQRVLAFRFDHGGDDAAGHRADIGAAVAADLGFIVYAAQRHAHVVAPRGGGDALGHRGLAHAGRACEADDLPLQVGGDHQSCQHFGDALLHVLQAVVVALQRLRRLRQVFILFGVYAPRDLQAFFNVAADHVSVRRAAGELAHPLHFLVELLFVRFGHLGLGDPLVQLIAFVALALAQLFADGVHLFPQVVIALIFIHQLFHAVGEHRVQRHQFTFVGEDHAELFHAAVDVELCKQGVFIFEFHQYVAGDDIRQLAGRLRVLHKTHDIRRDLAAERRVFVKEFARAEKGSFAEDRLTPFGAFRQGNVVLQQLDLRDDMRIFARNASQRGAALHFHGHAGGIGFIQPPLEFQDLHRYAQAVLHRFLVPSGGERGDIYEPVLPGGGLHRRKPRL